MLGNITSLTNNGLRDWLIQRFSAVFIGLYGVFLLIYLMFHPHMDYLTWRALFSSPLMKLATFITLVSILVHSWIGLWTIATDYLKVVWIRMFFYAFIFIVLMGLLLSGFWILWS